VDVEVALRVLAEIDLVARDVVAQVLDLREPVGVADDRDVGQA